MKKQALAIANNDLVYLWWTYSEKIPGCLGFTIRRRQAGKKPVALPTAGWGRTKCAPSEAVAPISRGLAVGSLRWTTGTQRAWPAEAGTPTREDLMDWGCVLEVLGPTLKSIISNNSGIVCGSGVAYDSRRQSLPDRRMTQGAGKNGRF